ncbi:MAG: hypothetical protein ACREHD_12435 [Pirellulales bacterium]
MEAGEAQPERSPDEEPGGERPAGERPARAPPSRPMSDDELKAIRHVVIGDDPDAQRFSLWGLLGIVTGASLVLAVGSYFPKPIFAGAVGIATLVTMVALSAMKHPPAVLQVAWWTLLLIYLMAIGSAIMG